MNERHYDKYKRAAKRVVDQKHKNAKRSGKPRPKLRLEINKEIQKQWKDAA